MPSGRRRKRPDPPPPVFFLDRGLGRYHVAEALRKRGYEALPMADVYPEGQDEHVHDDDWINRAHDEGWVGLTKDYNIIRDHTDALSSTTLRVFSLNNAHLTGPEMAERFDVQLNRIIQQAAKPGPYVYVIGSKGLERRWPES